MEKKMRDDFTILPDNLPQPHDDGSTNHLLGLQIPDIVLPSTKNSTLDLSKIESCYQILYFFPMMATERYVPSPQWNEIPGARGCTPQNISIGKHSNDFQKYGAMVIGISTQPINELVELSSIRKFSQSIVSDSNLQFQEKLNIPTFQFENKIMYKRLTLIVKKSKIVKVFYPIFPPDKHVFEILEWLENEN
jgi:peroxiredoxin